MRRYILAMEPFDVLAAPHRRRILTELRASPRSVNELAGALALSQPTVSKHLKVLRESGFVSCRGAASQHIYQLEAGPFVALDEWLAPFRSLWTRHLDALERYLDDQELP